MATKRQPSKQRRQTQNQKQRAALEARRAAAAAPARVPDKAGGSSGPSASTASTSSTGGGSVLSRLRGASTSGRAVRTSRGGASTTGGLPVGHRAAMSALFAAIAAAGIGFFLFKVPVDRGGEPIASHGQLAAEWARSALDHVTPGATAADVAKAVDEWLPSPDESYGRAYWPLSLAVLLPVLGTGLGFRAVQRRAPAKLVNRTVYVTLFGTLLASQLLPIFLPAIIGLFVAAYQVRKAEAAAAREALADEVPVDDDGVDDDGDVIDVEEADPDDEVEDEVVDR